ncbi:phosphonopyruvate decarboxylase [Paenibacillus thiaminolyticus]|uniref:phosphonopyruvate decarboxylase n=1 Tax=Paenibacillus thiaminolyticus TaxID=49283 RepID=UPI002543E690|nr:phosphonopyruvate decarboxylase [Paenibacillus thiaminolyticus]WII37847.1 phosphonopyruvate decarboxylase [Paenibacillus thiaminolyticus]
MDTKLFGDELLKLGFTFFSGVPCSYLKNLINYAINEFDYVAAANEGDAVAIASAAYIGGQKSVVLMQNSGLTNALSPLTSLIYPFRIPLLGFVTLRGEPGVPDEPQHELMGRITTQLLEMVNVEWRYLSKDLGEAKQQLIQANEQISRNRPFFFVVKKGTFDLEPLKKQQNSIHSNQIIRHAHKDNQMPARREALAVINSLKDRDTVQLATTGKTGRELYEIEDASNNLYMVGSMGCIGSFGLGLALSQPGKNIVAIDGDGSLLMRMGSLATNGYYSPNNMIHILLDNNAHESTGGQSTVSHNIDFVNIAASCGYTKSIHVHNLDELKACLQEWKKTKGLTFLYMKISNQSKDRLARPGIKPYEVKERLQRLIHDDYVKLEGVEGS